MSTTKQSDTGHLSETESEATTPGIHTVELDGMNVRYEVSGRGNPVILLHGWGCSLETVRTIAQAASAKHKVFNVDLPGFGKSEEPACIWGVEEYTRLIEKFVNRLSLDTPTLIGHSFGGRISIVFASRNKVERLVLVDAAGVKPRRSPKYYIKVYSFKVAKAFVKAIFPAKKANAIIENMRGKRGSADYKSSTPMMRSIMSKVVNEDLKKYMPSITAPTLLMWGANDTATPVSDARIMEKLIPDAGLVVFDNAGHYCFLDNPYRFQVVIKSFLESEK